MFEFLILVFVGLANPPYPTNPVQCEADSLANFCCIWHYEEAGCYEMFEATEKWCLDASTAEWVLRTTKYEPTEEPTTWHDRYILDHCQNCPDCCVVVPEEE